MGLGWLWTPQVARAKNMNEGEIVARDFRTAVPVKVSWRQGVITEWFPAAQPDNPEWWIAPPLLDLQINGFGGIDFQAEGLSVTDLELATRHLRQAGCTRYLLTLITAPWPQLMRQLADLRQTRSRSSPVQRALLGWHIEGPFLSAAPGFHGAHDPAFMTNPSIQHVEELRRVAGDDPVLLTLAPELPGAIPAIERAVALGLRVSLGHTNAPAPVILTARRAGATGFTHLGNGCPQELDRHDNILWRVFDGSGLTVSVIPDQIHVSPPLFRLIHQVLPADRICYTTDAMAAAGAGPGRFPLGTLRLDVGADQIVRAPGNTNYAGSALRPIEGIFRAARMLGCSWREVWGHFSEVPAAFLGLPGKLAPGQPASFCLLSNPPANEMPELRVIVDGENPKPAP